jgi:plasmid stabilization system protein ParE
MSDVAIRPEVPRDVCAIFDVNARAFGQPAEAKLVDALRAANAATLSLVAERDGRVVGHILFSPVRVEGEGAPVARLGMDARLATDARALLRMRLRLGSEAGTGRPDELIDELGRALGRGVTVLATVRERVVLTGED